MGCNTKSAAVFLVALACGTGATLFSKVMFDLESEDSLGNTRKFAKVRTPSTSRRLKATTRTVLDAPSVAAAKSYY